MTTKIPARMVAADVATQAELDVAMPVGAVVPFAGAASPSGWLLCGGQAVSRTTYAALFTAIGVAYGAGDGSTTFNLPDLRGRVVGGRDDMGTGTSAGRLTPAFFGANADTLGATGGSQSHTLTIAQMPAHDHDMTALGSRNLASGGGDVVPEQGSPSTMTTAQRGGGSAHNNVQPTLILNYLIKT